MKDQEVYSNYSQPNSIETLNIKNKITYKKKQCNAQ